MPLNVKTLTAKTNTLKTEFAGEEVNLVYRSGLITPEWEAKFKGKGDGFYRQLAEVVESWDLEDDPGKPYPIELGRIKELPIEFVAHLIQEMSKDLIPNRRTSGRSGGSSFAE